MMGQDNKGPLGASCAAICWLLAVLVGLLVVAILTTWANWPLIIVLVLGLIAVVAAGWVLPSYFCSRGRYENADDASVGAPAAATPAAFVADETPSEAALIEAPVALAGNTAAMMISDNTGVSEDAQGGRGGGKGGNRGKGAGKGAGKGNNEAADPSAVDPVVETGSSTEQAVAAVSEPVATLTPEPTDTEVSEASTPVSTAAGQPALFTSAPEAVDDLKRIKGVGPALEKTLNDLGIYTFAQISVWTAEDVAWVDGHLRFKGRIERDDWMSQAKTMAEES